MWSRTLAGGAGLVWPSNRACRCRAMPRPLHSKKTDRLSCAALQTILSLRCSPQQVVCDLGDRLLCAAAEVLEILSEERVHVQRVEREFDEALCQWRCFIY